jgi:hypothetical protein
MNAAFNVGPGVAELIGRDELPGDPGADRNRKYTTPRSTRTAAAPPIHHIVRLLRADGGAIDRRPPTEVVGPREKPGRYVGSVV